MKYKKAFLEIQEIFSQIKNIQILLGFQTSFALFGNLQFICQSYRNQQTLLINTESFLQYELFIVIRNTFLKYKKYFLK